MTGIDIAHLKTWVGREETATDRIDTRLVASFLTTLDRDPSEVKVGDDAPLCIHWCLAPPIVRNSATGPDGHPTRGGFLPPVPLPRRMWAGGKLQFRRALKVGDRVTRRSTIEAVELKEGRSGTLCFVTVRHSIETDAGVAIEERQDIVYRDAETAKPAGRAVEAKTASATTDAGNATQQTSRPDASLRFETSELALFRYSALTYNGHRIHYDRRYCIEEEGYPGLVVHGPLQATLLCHLAAETLQKTPSTFSYRGVKPLFDGVGLTVEARRREDGLDLQTTGADGISRMTATATI